MKAVVGEDALTTDDKNYLLFLEKFENQFLQQGKYEKRDIFRSLEGAWDLLRRFEKKALTKIGDQDILKSTTTEREPFRDKARMARSSNECHH